MEWEPESRDSGFQPNRGSQSRFQPAARLLPLHGKWQLSRSRAGYLQSLIYGSKPKMEAYLREKFSGVEEPQRIEYQLINNNKNKCGMKGVSGGFSYVLATKIEGYYFHYGL